MPSMEVWGNGYPAKAVAGRGGQWRALGSHAQSGDCGYPKSPKNANAYARGPTQMSKFLCNQT